MGARIQVLGDRAEKGEDGLHGSELDLELGPCAAITIPFPTARSKVALPLLGGDLIFSMILRVSHCMGCRWKQNRTVET